MSPLLALIALAPQTHVLTAQATEVIDGNRVKLVIPHHTAIVRLWGISAPPLNEKGGREAKSYLAQLVKGKTLTVELRQVAVKGVHTVWITYPFAGGAIVKVNTDMIAKGYAKWDRKTAPHAKDLQLWEQKAKQAKRGIWK